MVGKSLFKSILAKSIILKFYSRIVWVKKTVAAQYRLK